MYAKSKLAPAGSTGNNTHQSQSVADNIVTVGLEFRVTAIGATPTVTYKFQGSTDGHDVPDATSDWFDLGVNPAGGGAVVTGGTRTTVGVDQYFLPARAALVRKVRLVTSANTNCTYDAEVAVQSGAGGG